MAKSNILISLEEAAAALRSGRKGGPKNLGPKEIKGARQALGMTQEQFAGKVGVSLNAVRAWEQGARRPGLFATVVLSNLLAKIKIPEMT